MKINPDYQTARLNRFKTLRQQGFFETALEEGLVLLQQEMTYPDFFWTLAEVYLFMGMIKEAKSFALKAREENPRLVSVRNAVSRLLEADSQPD